MSVYPKPTQKDHRLWKCGLAYSVLNGISQDLTAVMPTLFFSSILYCSRSTKLTTGVTVLNKLSHTGINKSSFVNHIKMFDHVALLLSSGYVFSVHFFFILFLFFAIKT